MRNIIFILAILFVSSHASAQLSIRAFIPLVEPSDAVSEAGGSGAGDFAALNRSGIRAALEDEDFEKATDLFARASEANPSCYVCRYNQARALIKLGRPNEAVPLLQQVTAARPGFAEAHASLGDAYSLAGNEEAGLAGYRKALELSPDDALTLNNYANALERAGDYKEALEYFDRAIIAGPGLSEAHCSRGVLLFRTGKREEALWSLKLAERLNPDDPPTLSNIGVVLDAMGEKEEAHRYYRRALASDPRFGPALFNLGLITIEDGDRREAARLLRALEEVEEPLATELRKRFSSRWVIDASDLARKGN